MDLQILRLNNRDDFSISKGKMQARSFDFDTRIPLPYNPGMSSGYAAHKLFFAVYLLQYGLWEKEVKKDAFTETGGNNK
jgi:hypothetical protein